MSSLSPHTTDKMPNCTYKNGRQECLWQHIFQWVVYFEISSRKRVLVVTALTGSPRKKRGDVNIRVPLKVSALKCTKLGWSELITLPFVTYRTCLVTSQLPGRYLVQIKWNLMDHISLGHSAFSAQWGEDHTERHLPVFYHVALLALDLTNCWEQTLMFS